MALSTFIGDLGEMVGLHNSISARGNAIEAANSQRKWTQDQVLQNREYQTDMFNRANAFSAEQAHKQQQFQMDMSNTAHQREVRDLQRAGLNPILSVNHQGATTPSGAMATAHAPSGGMGTTSARKTATGTSLGNMAAALMGGRVIGTAARAFLANNSIGKYRLRLN